MKTRCVHTTRPDSHEDEHGHGHGTCSSLSRERVDELESPGSFCASDMYLSASAYTSAFSQGRLSPLTLPPNHRVKSIRTHKHNGVPVGVDRDYEDRIITSRAYS
jgi:hypothetical protein